ncbi:MAG: FRG domain-containing protein [Bacteroidetes bacterium]|nr:FRG domain-containing protein [Bacteroidota bacterium]
MNKQFIQLLEQVQNHIKTSQEKGISPLYFRGHGSADWCLTCSLGRHKKEKDLESRLYYDFISHAGNLIPRDYTTWDILFLMRHHGLPTRLLDWSETFSAALYFAIKEFDKKSAIWALNPFSINKKSIKSSAILNPNSDLTHSYFEFFIDKSVEFDGDVISLYPSKNNKRLLSQKGVFTLHINEHQPLEKNYRRHLKKFEITENMVESAKEFLSLAGVNEFSMFPDLDGLERHLKEIHKIRG